MKTQVTFTNGNKSLTFYATKIWKSTTINGIANFADAYYFDKDGEKEYVTLNWDIMISIAN